MSVLLVAPDGLLRQGIEQQFRHRQRQFETAADAERGAALLDAANGRFQLLLDATLPAILQTADSADYPLQTQRDLWASATRQGLPALMLSDGRIFDGRESPDWPETEVPKPGSRAGARIAAAEAALAEAAPDHILLRIGAVFGEAGDNPLTMILAGLRAGDEIPLGDRIKTAPSHVADIARVVSAMVDQLTVGAECRGIYHYNSGGAVTPLEFAEVVYAHAGQHIDLSGVNPVLTASQSSSRFAPLVPVLRCQRLLDDFGVKRLPWRSWLPMAVKNLCEDETK